MSSRAFITAVLLLAGAILAAACTSPAVTSAAAVDAQALATAILSSTGSVTLVPNSASFTGAAVAVGTYTDGPLGIVDGAIITSGSAKLAEGPNKGSGTTQANGLAGHPLCNALIPGYQSYDASYLRFNFTLQPGFNGISFLFVFGSDEYPEYVNTVFNDVFGFYVDGQQVSFDNTGAPITINGPFFNSENVVLGEASCTEYDGSTPLLQTKATVIPGEHVAEIVVCDAGDTILDSGVFLTSLVGCAGDDCSGTAAITCDGKGGDTDGDGVCDQDDNCPVVANEDQNNLDGDQFGDVCDKCPLDAFNDNDFDGICGDVDLCPDTSIPEHTVQARSVGVNRWALLDNDDAFDTRLPAGVSERTAGAQGLLGRNFTTSMTRGCSCEQIVAKTGAGVGAKKFGCTTGMLRDFIAEYGSA